MTYLVMIFVMVSAAVLQAQLPSFFALGQAKFPLLLAAVIYYSLNHEFAVMLTAAFLAGFLNDALGNMPMGYTAACFCVVGLVVSRFRRLVVTESPFTAMFFGGISGFILTLVTYVLLVSADYISWPVGRLTIKILGTGLLGAISAPLVLFLVLKLDQLVGNVRVGKEVAHDVFE